MGDMRDVALAIVERVGLLVVNVEAESGKTGRNICVNQR